MDDVIQFSHSRVGTFSDCKRKYKYTYIDKLKPFPNYDADNPLRCGTAMHEGIEKDAETAIKEYLYSYPIIDDLHINETIKMEYLIPIAKETFPKGIYEYKIDLPEFIGYIDLLVPVENPYIEDGKCFKKEFENTEWFDIYDFKYSNNVAGYMQSGQLHEYKYFFEKMNPGKKIRNLYFGFIPKVNIKQKKTETLAQFRDRIRTELAKQEIKICRVIYNENKVYEFLNKAKQIKNCETYPAEPCWLCDRFCEFKNLCQKGEGLDIMNLPKNKRRNIEKVDKKVIWLYGAPFSGKTYLANKFPDPLMLNTDGNVRFVDAPYIAIKNEVEVVGRITKTTLAWQIFKDAISELEKKQNTFKTIVVDLVEDTYEHCRLYMYDKLGITHESDDSFRAWDKVRTEFLSTMKRLTNLDYENIILISHEDTSKDITKKSGDKITAIKPNLQDKAALKIAGMVDIVARVIADEDKRVLSFKANDVVFGGGRLNIIETEIPCTYEDLMAVYDEANKNKLATEVKKPAKKTVKKEVEANETETTTTEVQLENTEVPATEVKEEPKRRKRAEGEKSLADKVEDFKAAKQAEKQEEQPAPTEQPAEEARKFERKHRVVEEQLKEEVAEETPQTTPTEEQPQTEEAPRRRRRRIAE